MNVTSTQPASNIVSNDGRLKFIGTYSPASITNGNKSCLFLGNENKLYYPNVDGFAVNAFRAYFMVDLGNGLGEPGLTKVRSFTLNFGDEDSETTGITTTDYTDSWTSQTSNSTDKDGVWYDLNGRRLSGKPTAKGLYIYFAQSPMTCKAKMVRIQR